MKKIALLFILALATVSVQAQTAPDLRALIEANRTTVNTLLAQRKDLIERLKNASEQDREAVRKELQQLAKDTHDSQRDLAKAIRTAMRERRLNPKG